jgi:glycosyltransferase involved in cell wall biosynthesis
LTEPRDPQRLLFLAQTLPYPPDGGVQIRTFNILRLLARRFEVHALCFYRAASHPTPDRVRHSVDALREHATSLEAFPIPQESSRVRLARDHLTSLATGRPYTLPAYDSAAFRRRLRELLAAVPIDVAHVDSLDLSAYLPLLDGLPTVCTHHNVESALLRRRAEQEPFLRAAYMRVQSRLLRSEEARWAPRVDLNATVSPEDAARLERIAPGARTLVVPNGVDTEAFQPRPGGDDGIVFVGGYTWFPNRDALGFFAEEILPRIRRKVDGEVPVRWVGRAPEAVRETYRDRDGIELTGYVESIQPLVGRAACYVVPLRVGGGTRLKILDAWAMGKAVVSTSVGCEGLEARDGENILVRDDPEAFADAVRDVLRDPELRDRLGRRARETAEQVYDWRVIGRRMVPEYERLAGVGRTRGRSEKSDARP